MNLRHKREPNWWMSYKIPFGKWKGDTLYTVYVNDYDYVLWMDQNCDLNDLLRAAVDACIEHYNS